MNNKSENVSSTIYREGIRSWLSKDAHVASLRDDLKSSVPSFLKAIGEEKLLLSFSEGRQEARDANRSSLCPYGEDGKFEVSIYLPRALSVKARKKADKAAFESEIGFVAIEALALYASYVQKQPLPRLSATKLPYLSL